MVCERASYEMPASFLPKAPHPFQRWKSSRHGREWWAWSFLLGNKLVGAGDAKGRPRPQIMPKDRVFFNTVPRRAQQVSWNPVQESVKETCTKIYFPLGYASRGSTRAYGISISIFRARAFEWEWSWFRLCWDSLRGDRARIWGRKKPGVEK